MFNGTLALRVAQEAVSLPVYPAVSQPNLERTVDAVHTALEA